MDVGCTSVIDKNMIHCVPDSQKSAGKKEIYFHLNLNLFKNMKIVPKTCFAFLSFKDKFHSESEKLDFLQPSEICCHESF